MVLSNKRIQPRYFWATCQLDLLSIRLQKSPSCHEQLRGGKIGHIGDQRSDNNRFVSRKMLLSSAVSAVLLPPRGPSTDNTIVKNATATNLECTATYIVEGQAEGIIVKGFPEVVEVGGAGTTFEIPAVETNTQVHKTTIDIEIEPQPLGKNFEFIGRYGSICFTERAPPPLLPLGYIQIRHWS